MLWIRTGLRAGPGPGPALYLSADPDPGSQTDPDPGQKLCRHKKKLNFT